jgi:hypothetical protein
MTDWRKTWWYWCSVRRKPEEVITKWKVSNVMWDWFCYPSSINWLMMKNRTGILCKIMPWQVKKKGKVPVLNWLSTMPWRYMEEWRHSSTFLDLFTRWGWVVSFTPLLLYPRGNNAMVHTAKNSVDVLNKVFGEQVINRGLWPLQSPDLHPCMSRNMFAQSEVCLEAESCHFETPL